MRRGALRAAAVIGALLLAAGAAALALFAALSAAIGIQAPDPFIPNGDPCCGHPNDWGEVIEAALGTVVAAFVVGALVALAISLFWWGARTRWLRFKRLLVVPAAGAVVAAIAVAFVLLPILGEGRTPPDCDTFVPTEAGWLSSNRDRHLRTAHGISRCGAMDGWRPEQVARVLGDPQTNEGTTGDGYWSYDGVAIYFSMGRVDRATLPDDY